MCLGVGIHSLIVHKFISCLSIEKVKMRGNTQVKSGRVMNTTNYNINIFKPRIPTKIKDNSTRHFQDFIVSNCQRFLFLCQKYLISGGYFHTWHGPKLHTINVCFYSNKAIQNPFHRFWL